MRKSVAIKFSNHTNDRIKSVGKTQVTTVGKTQVTKPLAIVFFLGRDFVIEIIVHYC